MSSVASTGEIIADMLGGLWARDQWCIGVGVCGRGAQAKGSSRVSDASSVVVGGFSWQYSSSQGDSSPFRRVEAPDEGFE